MIYSRIRYYVCCDKCGKTIETKAADELIAAETVKREGWECNKCSALVSAKPIYTNLCPKCKEE